LSPYFAICSGEKTVNSFFFALAVEYMMCVELEVLDMLEGLTIEMIGSGEARPEKTAGSILLVMS
jgi:hypothetical protein